MLSSCCLWKVLMNTLYGLLCANPLVFYVVWGAIPAEEKLLKASFGKDFGPHPPPTVHPQSSAVTPRCMCPASPCSSVRPVHQCACAERRPHQMITSKRSADGSDARQLRLRDDDAAP